MKGVRRIILLSVLALAGTAPAASGQTRLPDVGPIGDEPQQDQPQPVGAAQFERGKPHKVVDAVGWAFGIPKKIILWDRRAANHDVSPETEQNLAEYLDANGLTSTKVRINQYDPVDEWRRLRANKEVGAGWRYSVGAFSTLAYTVVPGRLFGNDKYNPYTDSIYIYSDIPCIAEEQASYAKLVASRSQPGTYAALTSLPVVRLWPAKVIKSDVLDYTLANGTPDEHREATRIFYAEYGAQVGGQASFLLGSNVPFMLVGAGVGHVAAYFNPEPSAESLDPQNAELTANQTSDAKPVTYTR